MAMHKYFADWYRAASVVPQPETLTQRWLAVEEIAANLTASQILTILRLVALELKPEFSTPEFLDSSFRKHDPLFPGSGNVEELRVLAGAILRTAIELENPAAVASALGLVTCTFGARKDRVRTPEHLTIAEHFLVANSLAVREIKAPPAFRVRAPTKEKVDELLPVALFAANQTQNLREPILAALADQSSRASGAMNQVSTALWRIIQSQREEINLLWWLQTKYSRALNKPFAEIDGIQAVTVFAVELADLTTFLPGPTTILGMLITALRHTKGDVGTATIANVTNAAPRSWRETMMTSCAKSDIAELSPITLAISKSLETEGSTDWQPAYRKSCDVNIDSDIAVRDLSYQLYREHLFARAVDELEK